MSYQVMDERFMLNEEPLEGASEALSNAKVLVYTTMGATEARRKYGVGAQSIAESIPCAVWEDGMGMYHVDFEALVPVLVQAIKELSDRVAKLEGAKRRTSKFASKEVLPESVPTPGDVVPTPLPVTAQE